MGGLVWNRVQRIIELRNMTKTKIHVPDKQQDFMENLADLEMEKKADEWLYGGPE